MDTQIYLQIITLFVVNDIFWGKLPIRVCWVKNNGNRLVNLKSTLKIFSKTRVTSHIGYGGKFLVLYKYELLLTL